MKTVVIFVLLLFPFYSRAESLHAVSLNLHCTFDNWKERIGILSKELSEIGPDFIAFQEVCRNDQEDMVKEIASRLWQEGYSYTVVDSQFTHRAWDKYEEHLVVLSRVPVEGVEKGFLPSSPLQRGFLALKLKGTWFVNTHLEYLEDRNYREEEVRFLAEKFKNTAHIIMGDFNSGPHSGDLDVLSDKEYVAIFPGPTYPSNAPKEMIDGFWVSKELRFSGISGKILFRNILEDQYLSDHLGVELKITR